MRREAYLYGKAVQLLKLWDQGYVGDLAKRSIAMHDQTLRGRQETAIEPNVSDGICNKGSYNIARLKIHDEWADTVIPPHDFPGAT